MIIIIIIRDLYIFQKNEKYETQKKKQNVKITYNPGLLYNIVLVIYPQNETNSIMNKMKHGNVICINVYISKCIVEGSGVGFSVKVEIYNIITCHIYERGMK